MKQSLWTLTLAALLPFTTTAQADTVPQGYQLEQVLIMSRHNLRAPLANNGSVLEQSTPNTWPEWEVPGGQLTTEGGVLEVYMGHLWREWLADKNWSPQENARRRHRLCLCQQSATYGRDRAVLYHRRASCDIPVHHQDKMGVMNPTFNP
jgi:glucose-1-phosphatase